MSAVLQDNKQGMVGRFELRRELGRGAQATVWLAFDPRLEREVAVKLMRATDDAAATNEWLQEARHVSRLTHPNIVPVFEADRHGNQAYMVFEYVPGRTLTEHLRARGALPPREAVELMQGVLDALRAAHEAGVIHRDLKPSNILVDGAGRARVMDFGIAARTRDGASDKRVAGTPGYMSPEAANGEPPSASMDLFAAGLVLAELLNGKPLIAERDPFRAIYRAAHEDLVLPKSLSTTVDDTLRAILIKSIARDPKQRHASAQALREALAQWLAPMKSNGDGEAAANSGTLEFLLRRMRHKSDFPALSDAVGRIQRVANSENDSVHSLSNEILKDVALTNKLLRMVNTAHYAHAGGGTISTVSRAVALIGFAGIRNMAMSLMLLEHMQDKSHANNLKDEFVRALMAGSLAGELSPAARDAEESFIGAMFQNLGRLLTGFYFPDEAKQIREMLSAAALSRSASVTHSEDTASTHVLGLSFEELGLGVAKAWGLPDNLQRCMRRAVGEVPQRMADKPADRLRWLAVAANEITDAMMRVEPGDSATISNIAQRYAPVLGVAVKDIEHAATAARSKLVQTAQAMNLQVQPGSPAGRLLRGAPPPEAPSAAGAESDTASGPDSLAPLELHATLPALEADVKAPNAAVVNAAEVMAAGIQDITNSMVESFRLNEVLRMILETMYRALGCRRIVFCLRDPKTETLTGRFGLGDGAEAACAVFKVPLKSGTQDLFTAVCARGADTLISDASAGNIAQRLPQWYRQTLNAPAFLLLPLMMKNAPFALIYADKATPGGIELDAKELSLLRTLRNQAVMAFKQAG